MVWSTGPGSTVLHWSNGQHVEAAAGGLLGEGEKRLHPTWRRERRGLWALILCVPVCADDGWTGLMERTIKLVGAEGGHWVVKNYEEGKYREVDIPSKRYFLTIIAHLVIS